MVRQKTTREVSQRELSIKEEKEHGSKILKQPQKGGESEGCFNFKILREKRGIHTFVHGE